MVAHLHGFLPIKWHDLLITWFCKITWQTKAIKSPLTQCLWPPKLAGWDLRRGAPNHNALFWSYGLAKSRDKWKLLYFHYHSACDHQTWQDVDLPLWAPTCKITWLWSRGLARSRDKLKLLYPLPQCLWPSDCLILRDHMTS